MKDYANNIKDKKGLVFNIQKFSVHDGPGIRTLVFLKGCPLRCLWCSNPEGMGSRPEVAYNSNKCIGMSQCGYCEKACGEGAVKALEEKAAISRYLCTDCGRCAAVCPSKALEVFGEYMGIEEILSVVEEDGAFYTRSGGGITLSGGEPLLQADFACRLLKEARSRGMETSIETTGYTDWENIEKVFRYVDFIHYDIKCLDPDKHKEYTGVPNERILENFEKVCNSFHGTPILVRTPVVPGFNDTEEDIRAIIDFIKGTHVPVQYEILPYHHFGEPKYSYFGKIYPLSGVRPLSEDRLKHLINLVSSAF